MQYVMQWFKQKSFLCQTRSLDAWSMFQWSFKPAAARIELAFCSISVLLKINYAKYVRSCTVQRKELGLLV